MGYPDLAGKVVVFYSTVPNSERTILIDNPSFENQAGRLFVTGRVADIRGAENWARAIPVSMAWDQVESYLVFDSLEQYAARSDEYRARFPDQHKYA